MDGSVLDDATTLPQRPPRAVAGLRPLAHRPVPVGQQPGAVGLVVLAHDAEQVLRHQGERSAGEVVEALGMSQPAVSKHLKVLREAGLADVRAEATRRIYRLRPEPLADLDAWLAPFRRYWSGKLDDLERYLDEEP